MGARRLKNINLVLEESDNSPQTSADSPRAALSSSSSNRSRRSVQKRVVSVPIKDVQRLSAPPPDSWAWRKYGQKPIKGSPYPRGYYRCSSSKGCPARKQVERSKADPDMIMVTYSSDHNHPSPPTSRSNLCRTSVPKSSVDSLSEDELEEEDEEEEELEESQEGELEIEKNPNESIVCKSEEIDRSEEKLSSLMDGSLTQGGEFGWLDGDFGESPLFESPILMEEDRMVFRMGEEEESLFADLGELPECSTVFRRGMAAAETGRRSLATTTG